MFFLQLQIEIFSPLKGTTLFYLPLEFQKLIHVFEALKEIQTPKKPILGLWSSGG
jgi:hypothetical protein